MISFTTVRLQLEQKLRSAETPLLRDFLGQEFEDQVLACNHGPKDEIAFQYPRVQFKVIDRFAYVIGIAQGSESLQQAWRTLDPHQVGTDRIVVLQSDLETTCESIEATATPIKYRFVTPWLALNQKNFQEYTGSRSQAFRREKLNRTVVGNCLGMCKSLGIALAGHIRADCSGLSSIRTNQNRQSMIGFVGTFEINLNLPGLIGLGRSASRGFGTVERQS
ncbi:MAG: hypothetical protein KDA87_16070 [Planctomycetales bacterium]|nr:hypothetical protein [Planctomycetales bacterium]